MSAALLAVACALAWAAIVTGQIDGRSSDLAIVVTVAYCALWAAVRPRPVGALAVVVTVPIWASAIAWWGLPLPVGVLGIGLPLAALGCRLR